LTSPELENLVRIGKLKRELADLISAANAILAALREVTPPL
jgi:hypothetical protein